MKRLSNILKYGVGDEARKRKETDKWKQREARFDNEELWQRDENGARRQYESYDDYLEHQSAKLERVADRLEEREDRDVTEFKRRFEGCSALSSARTVLCMGARLGAEVRALHSLGYFAVGIDLNPGENNAYVLPGDFHNIVFPDGSVDAIYTNCLDHVFDLDKVVGEVCRLLRPNGLFIADLLLGYEEGDKAFVPGEFEATAWRDTKSFIEKIRALGSFQVEEVRDVGQYRRDHWRQAVFCKPA